MHWADNNLTKTTPNSYEAMTVIIECYDDDADDDDNDAFINYSVK